MATMVTSANTRDDSSVDVTRDFTKVYNAERASLLKIVRRLGVPPGDAEDAVQDVFVVLHLRMPQLEPDAGLRHWLRAVAVRICSNRRRGIARRNARVDSNLRVDVETVADSRQGGPDGPSSLNEQRRLLSRAVSRLSLSQREIYVLAELEQCTVQEISARTRVCPGTVASRLRRARARVTSTLQRTQALSR